MKKNTVIITAESAVITDMEALCHNSIDLIRYARGLAVQHVNIIELMTNYALGRWIVEEQQNGADRAQYGRISQTLFTEFAIEKSQTLFGELKDVPFTLPWSHYLILMRIKDENERKFYEIEATKSQWNVRQLQRQYSSSLYERLLLSSDKDKVMELATQGQVIQKPEDIVKDPFVLEFLGFPAQAVYSETELETRLLNHLQEFIMELGTGFTFSARQKRFVFDEDTFYCDLVMYNRLLRCFVLFDLKVKKLTHRDLGQMQMYVNYYDRYEKTEDENPTVGILLCKDKNDAMVELTLPKDANIYAAKYELYLPDKKLLQKKLEQWLAEEGE